MPISNTDLFVGEPVGEGYALVSKVGLHMDVVT